MGRYADEMYEPGDGVGALILLCWIAAQMSVHWLTGALGLQRLGSLAVWAGVNAAAVAYLASQAAGGPELGAVLVLSAFGAVSYFLGSLSLEKRALEQQKKREFDAAESAVQHHQEKQ